MAETLCAAVRALGGACVLCGVLTAVDWWLPRWISAPLLLCGGPLAVAATSAAVAWG